MGRFSRTELLIGKDGLDKLTKSKVAIFGVGGVGTYAVESLARCGIGNFILVDSDVVEESNINRQLIATTSTIGMNKVDVMKDRILDINPDAKVKTFKEFFSADSSHNMLEEGIDYIVDAIDSVKSKIELIKTANERNIKIISAMGAGNKMDPTKLEVADIFDTEICPLAKIIRKEVRKLGINHLKVVYSKEKPIEIDKEAKACGSISFVPSVAGLIITSEIVKDLL